MDPDAINELIKAAPAIAKGAAAVGAAIPFTAIVKRMLGPAADELAEMWRDQVRMYRYERQLKCVKKAERMAEEAGFTPQAVPPKILFPLLEGASFEEDDNLHNMWAALLANAASPQDAPEIRPAFIATLRQMAPDEAGVLNWLYQNDFSDGCYTQLGEMRDVYYCQFAHHNSHYKAFAAAVTMRWSPYSTGFCEECLSTLEVLRLIHLDTTPGSGDVCSLTFWGYRFITACRPPKPKE